MNDLTAFDVLLNDAAGFFGSHLDICDLFLAGFEDFNNRLVLADPGPLAEARKIARECPFIRGVLPEELWKDRG